jgi:hypothetical protein
MVGVARSFTSGSGFVDVAFEVIHGSPKVEQNDDDYRFLRLQEGDVVVVRRFASPGGQWEATIVCSSNLAAKSEALAKRISAGGRFVVDYASSARWVDQFATWAGGEGLQDTYDALTDRRRALHNFEILLRLHQDAKPRRSHEHALACS